MAAKKTKAPFPYFGGKSRVAQLVWDKIGDVDNFIEPFAGSAAVLLARPHPPRIETINDADCYVANFWRSTGRDPEAVVEFADGPVNEADLHARHRWLVLSDEAKAFRERMRREPDYFDAKVAGWWCWGLCAWIGGGWCSTAENSGEWKQKPICEPRGIHPQSVPTNINRPVQYREIPDFPGYRVGDDGSVWTNKLKGGNDRTPGKTGEWRPMKLHMTKGYQRVNLDRDGKTYSRIVHRLVLEAFVGPRPDGMEGRHFPDQDKSNNRLENLSWATHTVNMQDKAANGTNRKKGGPPGGTGDRSVILGGGDGQLGHGVHAKGLAHGDTRPSLDWGQGVLKETLSGEGRPQLADAFSRGRGVNGNDSAGTCAQRRAWLLDWFGRLRDRLRTVRVCCGNWLRVCDSESVTTRLGVTGVFFDPPYSTEAGRDMNLYGVDSGTVAHDVRAYCLERGSDKRMRIVLAGYAGEGHEELERAGWEVIEWQAQGGYGNRSEKGKENAKKERLWVSPHCRRDRGLFDADDPSDGAELVGG